MPPHDSGKSTSSVEHSTERLDDQEGGAHMTKLTWGTTGERRYEAGTDRGVLYVPGLNGVAWSGLTAVKEDSSGGDAQPYYLDGFKYANISSSEEFEGKIEAFTSQRKLDVCYVT